MRMTLRGGGTMVPGIAWSQREETVLLKIDIPSGASPDNLVVKEKSVEWKEGDVALDMELFEKVNVDSVVKKSDGGRLCTIEIKKAASEWWPKLTSGKTPKTVKVDWGTWKDEDEAETEKYAPGGGGGGGGGMGGMEGMEGLGGMGGMGGMDGMNFDDVDKGDEPWMDEKDDDIALEDGEEKIKEMPMDDGKEEGGDAAGVEEEGMPDA